MNHVLDARVAAEIRAFELRFTCDACAHLDASRGGEACSLGYPNDAHRRTGELDRALREGPSDGRVHLTFCKEFELR